MQHVVLLGVHKNNACHQCDDEDNKVGGQRLKLLHKDDSPEVGSRCTEKDRKELLSQIIIYMYSGAVVHDLKKKVLQKKRFSS